MRNKDKNPLISVIMPAYNTAEMIGPAIESVLAQTYENLELIIVDDGSTDGTRNAAEIYSVLDKRVRVFGYTENRGVSHAENIAMEKASGRLVGFVDSDDTIAPDMYEKLYGLMGGEGKEISVSSYSPETARLLKKITREGFMKALLADRYKSYMPCCLFDRSLFDGISFDEELTASQDADVMPKLFAKADSVRFTPETLYRYFSKRPGNTSSMSDTPNGIYVRFLTYSRRYQWVLENYPESADDVLRIAVNYASLIGIRKGFTREEIGRARNFLLLNRRAIQRIHLPFYRKYEVDAVIHKDDFARLLAGSAHQIKRKVMGKR